MRGVAYLYMDGAFCRGDTFISLRMSLESEYLRLSTSALSKEKFVGLPAQIN